MILKDTDFIVIPANKGLIKTQIIQKLHIPIKLVEISSLVLVQCSENGYMLLKFRDDHISTMEHYAYKNELIHFDVTRFISEGAIEYRQEAEKLLETLTPQNRRIVITVPKQYMDCTINKVFLIH